MSRTRASFYVISVFVLLVFAANIIKIQSAAALTDASSSDATTSQLADEITATDTGTTTSTTEVANPSTPVTEAPAPSLSSVARVHITGTKYVDYCTDGTTVTAYPGDPLIDANLNKPEAPTPKCPDGQTWDHTSGMDAYDTASSDLGVNQYAQQPDGSYVVHYPAATYTDATSTSQWPDRIVTVPVDPTGAAPEQTITQTEDTSTSSFSWSDTTSSESSTTSSSTDAASSPEQSQAVSSDASASTSAQ